MSPRTAIFAVNDRESFISTCLKLFQQLASYEPVVILNNRGDRRERIELFAWLAQYLKFNRVVTFGAYEGEVNQFLSNQPNLVLNLGATSKFKRASGQQLLQQICNHTESQKILLIGAVNIHTGQAEKLLHFFEQEREKGSGAIKNDLSNIK